MQTFDEQLEQLLRLALAEDVGNGDHSTLACIDARTRGRAVLKIKQDGILAGLEVARKLFFWQEPEATFTAYKQDGDVMRSGEEAFSVEAMAQTILKCERLLLNCMQRMSGIATLTRQYADKIAGYKTRVLDTRKTTPNFRLLEKEAVRLGGGENHRFGLYDMIMLKDNHIDYCGGIEKAIDCARAYLVTRELKLKIEIETRSLEEVRRVVAHGGIDRIMLDNFTVGQVDEAMKIIGKSFETEASGGIHLDNIADYARTGVDFVSVGALIHQAKSLDLSLKAVLEQI